MAARSSDQKTSCQSASHAVTQNPASTHAVCACASVGSIGIANDEPPSAIGAQIARSGAVMRVQIGCVLLPRVARSGSSFGLWHGWQFPARPSPAGRECRCTDLRAIKWDLSRRSTSM